jgi:toxin ParE1/3/4
MTYTWWVHPEAHDELLAAARFYDSRSPDLGTRLVSAAEKAVESVLDPSFHWGFYRHRRSSPQFYSRNIDGFPYNLVFMIQDEAILVIAYAHEKQAPGYWAHRARST